MKPSQLEILIFTDNRFTSNQLGDSTGNQSDFGSYKNLIEAFWSGLLRRLLPELYGKTQNLNKMALWQVIREDHFLDLEYGEQSQAKDRVFSMNPHFFLELQLLS